MFKHSLTYLTTHRTSDERRAESYIESSNDTVFDVIIFLPPHVFFLACHQALRVSLRSHWRRPDPGGAMKSRIRSGRRRLWRSGERSKRPQIWRDSRDWGRDWAWNSERVWNTCWRRWNSERAKSCTTNATLNHGGILAWINWSIFDIPSFAKIRKDPRPSVHINSTECSLNHRRRTWGISWDFMGFLCGFHPTFQILELTASGVSFLPPSLARLADPGRIAHPCLGRSRRGWAKRPFGWMNGWRGWIGNKTLAKTIMVVLVL